MTLQAGLGQHLSTPPPRGSGSMAAGAGASSGTVITHPFVLVALVGKRQRSLSLLAHEMREMLTPVISA